jgi:hypothetical protein
VQSTGITVGRCEVDPITFRIVIVASDAPPEDTATVLQKWRARRGSR